MTASDWEVATNLGLAKGTIEYSSNRTRHRALAGADCLAILQPAACFPLL